jgi:hypothetical protein
MAVSPLLMTAVFYGKSPILAAAIGRFLEDGRGTV